MIRWTLFTVGSIVLVFVAFAACLILPSFAPSTEAMPNRARDTQIVVQWPTDDVDTDPRSSGVTRVFELARGLLAIKRPFGLEDTLQSEAAGAYWDSGNDIGSGAFNVYLYAADPDRAVNRVVAVSKAGKLIPGMRIGVAHNKNVARTD